MIDIKEHLTINGCSVNASTIGKSLQSRMTLGEAFWAPTLGKVSFVCESFRQPLATYCRCYWAGWH